MSTTFAAAEARLGASTLARLGNASLQTLVGGPVVDGVFDRRALMADLGNSGFLARSVHFVCAQADADAAGFTEGVVVTDGVDRWTIELATRLLELGQVDLDLKRAP